MLSVLKDALVSPLLLFVLISLLASRCRARRRVGYVALAGLYLAMTPCVGTTLLALLEPAQQPFEQPVDAAARPISAVVVLGAGLSLQTPEWPSAETPKPFGMERLRYGVTMARRLQVPIVLSGGPFPQAKHSEAQIMAEVVTREYGMPVDQVVLEDRSRTTEENAYYVAQLAHQRRWQRLVLVTQAYHMQRAVTALERCGVEIVPAPTGWRGHRSQQPYVLTDFLPSAGGLQATLLVAHEGIGMLWYRLRHWSGAQTSCAPL